MDNSETKVPGRIETETAGAQFRIHICNAQRFNAMSLSMWEALTAAAEAADKSPDTRVVVLSGEGHKAFASGADISEFATHRKNPEQGARYSAAVAAAQQALMRCRHPVVARVRGVCMGGGMALAIACDLRYCTYDARFRMPAGRLGLGYALDGIRRFAHIVGPSRTADLFFTARTFDGHEAERIGLVHEAINTEIFDAVVDKRIEGMTRLAPLTLRAAKLSIRHILNESGAPNEAAVQEAIRACYESEDYIEGQQAFMEKRRAQFKGK